MLFNFRKNKCKTISVYDLDEILKKITLIDIREPNEYKRGHIPSAKNIPMGDIIGNPEKYLKKDKEYHIICQSGARSSSACNELTAEGYNVVNVSGGTGAYLHPLER